MKLRCDCCKYWEKQEIFKTAHKDDLQGKCHRFPPQIDSVYADKLENETGEGCEASVTCWHQPLTSAGDWCGEYKRKQK